MAGIEECSNSEFGVGPCGPLITAKTIENIDITALKNENDTENHNCFFNMQPDHLYSMPDVKLTTINPQHHEHKIKINNQTSNENENDEVYLVFTSPFLDPWRHHNRRHANP